MTEMTDFIYWPDTYHPSLEHHSGSIRSLIAQNRSAVQIPKMDKIVWSSDPTSTTDVTIKTEILTVHKAAGPAPYVGQRFSYVWKVAVGEGNRWVAGPAEIHYYPWDPTVD